MNEIKREHGRLHDLTYRGAELSWNCSSSRSRAAACRRCNRTERVLVSNT